MSELLRVQMMLNIVSPTRVKTTISAANIAVAGTTTVKVFTPAPGGGITSALTFAINYPPVPTVTDRTPFLLTAGGGDFTLTVNGTDLVSDSIVRFNGAPCTTTFVSSSRLTAVIVASNIAGAETAQVTVYNPATGGGGGTSNAQTSTINWVIEAFL